MSQNKPVPAPERVVLRRRLAVLLWRAVAVLGLTLGLLGVVLPVVPTVPFLILSAWAASKAWPAFEIWLLNHRLFGPPIVQWRERGAVPRRAKWFSTLMMAASGIGMQFFTGNNLAGKLPVDAGKDGKAFVFRGGFCMEPSRFPDSPNHPELPSTSVKPGEFYTGCIEYRFSAR